ncbi:delta(14)-sterol reductase TM7SF2 [Alosa sapidissima]|uniref:delta(14)-sterol reductase TM7SF2 n=1 Tax=Alosa sapidissima TaxID=34773 RepID=UPI001C09BFF2|nr:delta(14)-sterol reductase TM7SF2 [Alosa sapidissima]XP_041919176.1 delta(14)-sterol reductase TM7SF2 [Alosa sapidissima]
MSEHTHLKQLNGSAATHCARNEEQHNKCSDGKCSKKVQQDDTWSTFRIIRVCTLMTPTLTLLYEGCRHPSEPWALLGDTNMPLWDWTILFVVLIYTVLQGTLYYLPFGPVELGGKGSNGKVLKYNCNSLHAFVVSSAVLVGMWSGCVFQACLITNRIYSLMYACYVVSLLMAIVVYLHSCKQQTSNEIHTKTGLLREFSLGKEISPRIAGIDMKQFFMVRIGFMGWGIVMICYLLAEIERDGLVSLPMLLVVIFQLLYIVEFFIDEASVLPTREFTNEGIGFLMIHGEYIYLPFCSSIPAFFLFHRPLQINLPTGILICLLYGVGLVIYHFSNEQKGRFRKDPSDPAISSLKTISSPTGQNLLVSGWFGWVRHPNYLGDILMTWAWTLPCGFSSVLPYIPAVLCTNILRERANEIEEACQEKHGEAWQEYCRCVPYQLLPYIY